MPVHLTSQIGLRFGLELVWGWLEIYLGLICRLLRVGSRFSETLFEGSLLSVLGCISKLLVLY